VPIEKASDSKSTLANHYGDAFYKAQMDDSLHSAYRYISLLSPLHRPNSVVDIGCGRGTWLKAFFENGATTVVGYDGTWNSQEKMIDKSIVFHGADLNQLDGVSRKFKFDLAMSLEVAEHLEPSSSEPFVRLLTELSDVVLFGAAYPGQGGENHINEQRHSYWAKIFTSLDYLPFDVFRPQVWGSSDIPFWYQQNTFLYIKANTSLLKRATDLGFNAIDNIGFMDCVHPTLYDNKVKLPQNEPSLIKRLRRAFGN
jgi:SAM-dependent methyltransferase